MTNTPFAPDFNFGPNNNNNNNNQQEVSGDQELFLFPPYTRTGVPTFFNWLNADVSGYDGVYVTKKVGPGTPGATTGIFTEIPDDDLMTDRPIYRHGKNNNTNSADKIRISGMNQVKYLFEHTYEDRQRWEACWHGYYSNTNWYQYFNAAVYNTKTSVYPFATKGISMRLRVPSGDSEANKNDVAGTGKNYGNHLHINRAYGLWVDLDGKYYIYKMECHGDNRYRSIYGGKVRPKDGVIYAEGGRWMGDRYFFLEEQNPPVGKTHDHHNEGIIGRSKNKGLTLFSNEKNIENLFFCGFSIDFHHDRSAGSKRNHSYLLSRLTPIPFYSPRHDTSVKAVLGEPTELDELRSGHKKLHFWDPPQEYYEWTDEIEYDDSKVDTVPEGDDTLDLSPEDLGSQDGAGGIIEPSTIFVNEDGDGLPIPADFDLEDYLDTLAEDNK